jgi:LysM repeat protein
MDEKKNPDPWAIPDIGPETDEKKSESTADAFDATQWHEVKKGETLWKIAEQYYY